MGKALLLLNGFSLASFALRGSDKAASLRAATGLVLKGESEILANTLMLNLGLAGVAGMYAGVTGPESNALSVAYLGAVKCILAYTLLNFAGGVSATQTIKPDALKLVELLRLHGRTGAVLLAYAVLLAWRNRGRAARPRWAEEMEGLSSRVVW